MKNDNQQKVYIGCEVPAVFHGNFKTLAKNNERSLSGEIRIALESHLRRENQKRNFKSTATKES